MQAPTSAGCNPLRPVPEASASHAPQRHRALFFALATTAYILVAIQLEERDLVDIHGADYVEYRRRTPMLIPLAGTRVAAEESASRRAA